MEFMHLLAIAGLAWPLARRGPAGAAAGLLCALGCVPDGVIQWGHGAACRTGGVLRQAVQAWPSVP